MHVQHMLEMSRVLYTGGNFNQIFGKIEENSGTLFMIMIWQINKLTIRCQHIFLKYMMGSQLE